MCNSLVAKILEQFFPKIEVVFFSNQDCHFPKQNDFVSGHLAQSGKMISPSPLPSAETSPPEAAQLQGVSINQKHRPASGAILAAKKTLR